MKELIKKLSYIQKNLDAPKNQWNSFRGFAYRSCEDILEGLKPHLDDDTVVILSDALFFLEGRHYVQSTATFHHKDEKLAVTSPAREMLNKSGFDEPQCSGTAISYARKYALNGLFLIDDQKDPDTDEYQKTEKNPVGHKKQNNQRQNNNNNQKQNNNNNQKHKSSRDKISIELKEQILRLTNGFKDKTKVSIICTDLGVKDISEIAYRDESQKREMIEFLKNKKY